MASLGENFSQIYALCSSNDISREWFDEYDKKHYSLENKLINYNKSQIEQLKQKTEWKDDYVIKEIEAQYIAAE